MVARDGPIRAANQDSAAARRARIGPGRSESIEPSTRGLTIRGPQTRTPARGRGSLLQCLGGTGVPITEGQRLFFLDRLNVVDDVHDPSPGGEVHALHTGHTIEASST